MKTAALFLALMLAPGLFAGLPIGGGDGLVITSGGSSSAAETSFDDSTASLGSDNIQGAIEALDSSVDALETAPPAHASSHAEDAADEIEVESLGSAELTTGKVLRPDGSGGVSFLQNEAEFVVLNPTGLELISTDVQSAIAELDARRSPDCDQYDVPYSDGSLGEECGTLSHPSAGIASIGSTSQTTSGYRYVIADDGTGGWDIRTTFQTLYDAFGSVAPYGRFWTIHKDGYPTGKALDDLFILDTKTPGTGTLNVLLWPWTDPTSASGVNMNGRLGLGCGSNGACSRPRLGGRWKAEHPAASPYTQNFDGASTPYGSTMEWNNVSELPGLIIWDEFTDSHYGAFSLGNASQGPYTVSEQSAMGTRFVPYDRIACPAGGDPDDQLACGSVQAARFFQLGNGGAYGAGPEPAYSQSINYWSDANEAPNGWSAASNQGGFHESLFGEGSMYFLNLSVMSSGGFHHSGYVPSASTYSTIEASPGSTRYGNVDLRHASYTGLDWVPFDRYGATYSSTPGSEVTSAYFDFGLARPNASGGSRDQIVYLEYRGVDNLKIDQILSDSVEVIATASPQTYTSTNSAKVIQVDSTGAGAITIELPDCDTTANTPARPHGAEIIIENVYAASGNTVNVTAANDRIDDDPSPAVGTVLAGFSQTYRCDDEGTITGWFSQD